MKPTLAERFAAFAAGLEPAQVPLRTQRTAVRHMVDTLAAGVAGADADEAVTSRHALRETGSAVVWGTPDRCPPSTAALLNGIAAHAYELDDSGGCDHSGAVVLPAVLAAAAATSDQVDGQRMVLAIVVGYELGRRVQTALGGYDSVNNRGWHSTGVCGPFAAAAAAAVVLGLDPERMAHAIGLAATSSAGSWAFMRDGAMSKRLHVGRSAQGGLESALLAARGFTGPRDIFEAPWGGFLDLYRGTSPARPEALTEGLGQTWQIDLASIKPHATCRSTHAAIDAVLDLRTRLGDTTRIVRIEVAASRLIADMCGGRSVDTLTKAQLSLPYSLAIAAVFGRVDLDDILAGRHDRRVVDLMRTIEVTVDPEQSGGAAPPRLTCHTDDGTIATIRARAARGGWTDPLTRDAVEAKARRLFRRRLDAAATDRLIASLDVTDPPPPLVIADLVRTSPEA